MTTPDLEKRGLTLPMSAEGLVPHRDPMRLIDVLVEYGDDGGVVEAELDEDCLLVDKGGRLEEVALAELLAQSYAAVKGYGDLLAGREVKEGFLVSIKKVEIFQPVFAAERLRIRVSTVGSFEGFAVAEGEITRDGLPVAAGSLKLWIP